MSDDDIICLDDTLEVDNGKQVFDPPAPTVILKGVPRTFSKDDGKRFSFGSGSLRRSLSQPVLKATTNLEDHAHPNSVRSRNANEAQSTQANALLSPRRKGTKKKAVAVLEEFYGVYCLISRSTSKHYKNRCYIGYTVDPNRRINQHNGGREKGGAKKTENRGPWDMVCIVTGFPNSVAALRFEWAWQNPEKSKVTQHLGLKKERKETPFAFRLRVACHLLKSYPWRRFALSFRWLIQTERLPFPVDVPDQMGTVEGLVEKTKRELSDDIARYRQKGKCKLCHVRIEKLSHLCRCVNRWCQEHFHLKCLAAAGINEFHKQDKGRCIIPLRTRCSSCHKEMLWGEVVREHRWIVRSSEQQTDETLQEMVPTFEL